MGLSEVDIKSNSPALIIGGGKTGMDTALALMDGDNRREITLLNGKGAIFGNRDRMFPTGAKRWWQGEMVGSLSADVVGRFNGDNALSTFEHFRSRYAIEPPPLKWSAPIVRKRRTINGHHETQARRDCREVTAG
jgi:hypothetical protein